MIPSTLYQSKFGLKDALDLFGKNLSTSINCHAIGTIQSFDSTKQTAQVAISYTKTIFQYDSDLGSYQPVSIPYPVLVDCPCVVISGGAFFLNLPIQTGDGCYVLFNDRDMDNWFSGQDGVPVNTARTHSFADGVVLVGLNPPGNAFPSIDSTHALLRGADDGSTQCGISATQIRLANSANGTLGAAMTSLLSSLSTFLGSVSSATTAAEIATAAGVFVTGPPTLASIISNIEGLLE